jgi:hypothetical protein
MRFIENGIERNLENISDNVTDQTPQRVTGRRAPTIALIKKKYSMRAKSTEPTIVKNTGLKLETMPEGTGQSVESGCVVGARTIRM